MALQIRTFTAVELCSVIRFHTVRGRSAVEIHEKLCAVYGKDCMSVQMVRRWKRMFEEGRETVDDDACSGRPRDSTSAVENVQQIHDLLEED